MTKKAELVGNYFGAIYLTVISFLQGFALSQLVPTIVTYFELADDPFTNILLIPLALMLLIIFIVWHHYAIGIFFLRWFPNIIDTIIPFVISIGQFFLISYLQIDNAVTDIDIETWTIGFAVFFAVGSFAYFAAAWRIEPDLFLNIMFLNQAVIHSRHVTKYYNISGLSVLFQGLFAMLIIFIHKEQLLYFSLIFFITHLVVSEYFLLRNIKPHFVKSIDEYDDWRKEMGAL